ncbi:hypothetical protein [Larkinella harenae]
MKNIENTSLFKQQWYLLWVFLPIGAYYFSMIKGTGLVYYYPLFLVAVQFISIGLHPAAVKPNWWWCTLVTTILFCILIAILLRHILEFIGYQFPSLSFRRNVIQYILSFYGSQLVAELLCPQIFRTWRYGWWTGGNILAAVAWISVFLIIYHFSDKPHLSLGNFWIYRGYVAPSFIANAVTGYFLHLGTQKR